MPSALTKEIQQEINLMAETIRQFRAGEITQDKFQRFRLQHGIYGQRQDGVQMIRIKIPLGRLNAEQIECIADLSEKYAHKNAHITTRQDIQIHYVKLENCPEVMTRLESVGLTTREACGNTVRNVTASPSAGTDAQEIFDVTPYAHAFTYHMLRNPICQNMGRKFKVAFDGGGVMTALPLMHEIGLIAKIRKEKGKDQRGFQVFVGGGLGSYPKVALELHSFLPVEELIAWGETIIRVFDRHGERKVRMKARLKFLIEKIGFEKFKQLLDEERRQLVVPPEWNNYLKHIDTWTEKPPVINDQAIPKASESPEFLEWKKTNVSPQKQSGYLMVEVRLTTGDMKPGPMRTLAAILRRYAGGEMRTMVHQNFLIRWVRNQDLPALYQELKKIDFVKKDAQTIYDVTACPGTDTCRLGISSSMGLARTLEEHLYKENGLISQVAKDLHIKISGCPNSCGQHHLANIGFYGGAIPINGHVVPAFQMLLGGSLERDLVLATPVCQVPSKNIPEAVIRLVKNYVKNRQGTESFNAYYKKLSKESITHVLGDLLKIPSYEDQPDFYVDWEGSEDFALQKGVIGECAGQMVDDRPPVVSDGDEPLRTAEAFLKHADFASASHKAYEAMIKAANGLLYHRLVQTFNDQETSHEFENQFVRKGLFPQWAGLHTNLTQMRANKINEVQAKQWVEMARKFVHDCHAQEPQIAQASPRKKPAGTQPDNLFI